MLFPKIPFPSPVQDFEACLIVVLRNLRSENWTQLISEAQAQMIKETEVLIYSPFLSTDQALQLIYQWQSLEASLTTDQWESIVNLLKTWHETRQLKQGAIDGTLIPFLQKQSIKILASKSGEGIHSIKVAS